MDLVQLRHGWGMRQGRSTALSQVYCGREVCFIRQWFGRVRQLKRMAVDDAIMYGDRCCEMQKRERANALTTLRRRARGGKSML